MRLRHGLERAFFALERLLTALLYPCYALRERLAGPSGTRILMYHQVGRPPAGAHLSDWVSPERFEVQVQALLRAGYRIVPLSSLIRHPEGPPSCPPRRCAALTFDDGFRGQFAHAYPVLRRHGVPATFFIIAGRVGTDDFYPHLPLQGAARSPERELTPWRPLGWEELREMARNGMSIGSHSVSHRSLGCLGTEETEAEVRRSKEILEEGLGQPVDLFAYPFGSEAYGDFDARIQAVLRRCGYVAACTTVVGSNGPRVNPLALRRIPVEESDGPFRLWCKVAGAYDWVGWLKSRWQRIVRREEAVTLGSLAPADCRGGPRP